MIDPRQALIETGLERVAEAMGDVTPAVMAQFYAAFPEARTSFVHHQPQAPERLEAEMVGNTLHYVFHWFAHPREAEFALMTSVPHHRVALDVPPQWYRGFFEAFFAAIAPALAGCEPPVRDAFTEVRDGLVGLVESNRFV